MWALPFWHLVQGGNSSLAADKFQSFPAQSDGKFNYYEVDYAFGTKGRQQEVLYTARSNTSACILQTLTRNLRNSTWSSAANFS